MTDQQLAAIARTSITTSDAPPELIVDAVRRVDEWLADPTASDSRVDRLLDLRDDRT
jgi:hypothetical protein